MKILVIGADGQLGSDLCKTIASNEIIPVTIKELDVTDAEQAERFLAKRKPDLVINTAAYHRVDDCEENDLMAFRVNALGAKYVAQAANQIGTAIAYISTDYVFDGDKGSPYDETETPNPRSAYAISKLAGEYYTKYENEKHFVIRSSGLYGCAGCLGKGGGNFVENMINLSKKQDVIRVVDDELLAPTYTFDLAKKVNELCRTALYGTYHITNKGECSWYDFACEIFNVLNIPVKVQKISAKDYKAKANRPKYSVLRNANLQKLGLDELRPWKDALRAYLTEKGHLLK